MVTQDSEDDVVMIENLTDLEENTEMSEDEGWYDNATTTVDEQKQTRNPSETTSREKQTVREYGVEGLGVSLELTIEGDKTVGTGGDPEDIEPGTIEDSDHVEHACTEHWTGRSDRERQGVHLPAPPISMTRDIQEKNCVRKTLEMLSLPPYDNHTSIVGPFDTDITRKDFERFKEHEMLNEGLINWMM